MLATRASGRVLRRQGLDYLNAKSMVEFAGSTVFPHETMELDDWIVEIMEMQIQTWQIKQKLDFVQDVLIDLDKSQHHNEKKDTFIQTDNAEKFESIEQEAAKLLYDKMAVMDTNPLAQKVAKDLKDYVEGTQKAKLGQLAAAVKKATDKQKVSKVSQKTEAGMDVDSTVDVSAGPAKKATDNQKATEVSQKTEAGMDVDHTVDEYAGPAKKGKTAGMYPDPYRGRFIDIDVSDIEGIEFMYVNGVKMWFHRRINVVVGLVLQMLYANVARSKEDPTTYNKEWDERIAKNIPGFSGMEKDEQAKKLAKYKKRVEKKMANFLPTVRAENTVTVKKTDTTAMKLMQEVAGEEIENCTTPQRFTRNFGLAGVMDLFQNIGKMTTQEKNVGGKKKEEIKGGHNSFFNAVKLAAFQEPVMEFGGEELQITHDHLLQCLNASMIKEVMTQEGEGSDKIENAIKNEKKAAPHRDSSHLSYEPIMKFARRCEVTGPDFMFETPQVQVIAQFIYSFKEGFMGFPSMILQEALKGVKHLPETLDPASKAYFRMSYYALEVSHGKETELLDKVENGIKDAFCLISTIATKSIGQRLEKVTDAEIEEQLQVRGNAEEFRHGLALGSQILDILHEQRYNSTEIMRTLPFFILQHQKVFGFEPINKAETMKMLTIASLSRNHRLPNTTYLTDVKEEFKKQYEDPKNPPMKHAWLYYDMPALFYGKRHMWEESEANENMKQFNQMAEEFKVIKRKFSVYSTELENMATEKKTKKIKTDAGGQKDSNKA